jgi:tetratricopeptide (TPR) repeat protein
LVKVPGLQVAARTSAFSFKGKNVNVSEIGRALGVASVLEGSVRKSGDQVRITTQLINASDGYHLWSATYDRKLTDIFAVQDEIAKAVVSSLKIKLLPGQSPSADEHRTASSEAYLHFLEGRKLLAGRTQNDFRRALAAFQRAVDLDPGFAPAWAGLGYMRSFTADAPNVAELVQTKAQALADVDKSIALAPRLAEAYAIRGILHLRDRFDWNSAQIDFERALALNPGDPFALEQYGFYWQGWRGNLREASETLRKAIERDPLNSPLWDHLGNVYLFSGELARAHGLRTRA